MAFINHSEKERINSRSQSSPEDKKQNTILSKLNNNNVYNQKRERNKNTKRIETSNDVISSNTNKNIDRLFDQKLSMKNEDTKKRLYYLRSKSVNERTLMTQRCKKTLYKNLGIYHSNYRKDRLMESNKAINNSNNNIQKKVSYLRKNNFLSYNNSNIMTTSKKLNTYSITSNANMEILSAPIIKSSEVKNNINATNREISTGYFNQKYSELHNYNCHYNYSHIYKVNKSAAIKNLQEKYQLLPSYNDYSFTKTKALSEIKCSQSQFINTTALMSNFNIKVSKNSSSWEEKKHKNSVNNILANNYKTYNMNHKISSKCSINIKDSNEVYNHKSNKRLGDYNINIIEKHKSDDSIDTDIILNINNIKELDRSLDGKSNKSYSYYNHKSNNNIYNILNDDFLHISYCKNKDMRHDEDNNNNKEDSGKIYFSCINNKNNTHEDDDNNDRETVRFSNISRNPSNNSSGKPIKHEDYNEDANEGSILYTNKRVQRRIDDLNADSNSSNNLNNNRRKIKATFKKEDYTTKSSNKNSDDCYNKQFTNKTSHESMNTKATSQVNSDNNYFSQSSYSIVNNNMNNNINNDGGNNNIANENNSKYLLNTSNNIYKSNNENDNISFSINKKKYNNNFKDSGINNNTYNISNSSNKFYNRNINYNKNYIDSSNNPNYYYINYYNNTSNTCDNRNINISCYNNNRKLSYSNNNSSINSKHNMPLMNNLLGRNLLNNSNFNTNSNICSNINNHMLNNNYNCTNVNNKNTFLNTNINNSNYLNSYMKFPSSSNESQNINKNTNFIYNNNKNIYRNNNHLYPNNKNNTYNNSNITDQSNYLFSFNNNNNNSSSNNKNKGNLFDSNIIFDNTKTSNISDDISLFNISNYDDESSIYIIKDGKKKEVIENAEFNKQKLIVLTEKLLNFSTNELINLSYSKPGSQSIQSFINQVNYLNLNTNNTNSTYCNVLLRSELAYILKFYEDKIRSILFKLIEILPDIMENQFSSFAFQKILPYANEHQRLAIWKRIETKLDKYSVHKIANRCLQDIISSINCYNEERYVTKLFFSNDIVSKLPFISLSLNEFGFFVIVEIIKIIEKRSCNTNNSNFNNSNYNSNSTILYMLEKLVSFTSKLIVNKYGVNIFKLVLEIVNSRSSNSIDSNSSNNNLYNCLKQKIIDIILSDFNKIAKSKFGYYGLSTLFNIFDSKHSIPILKELIDNIEEFCICSFSYKLIKKLLNSIKKDVR